MKIGLEAYSAQSASGFFAVQGLSTCLQFTDAKVDYKIRLLKIIMYSIIHFHKTNLKPTFA